MALIQCFDPTLGCLDTKIWWKYHPDSPWRIEAVAAVSFVCIWWLPAPSSNLTVFFPVQSFPFQGEMEKKDIHRDFLANSSHCEGLFRSFNLQKTGNLAPNTRQGTFGAPQFLLPGTIAAKKDGGKEFLAPRQGWGSGRWLASYQYHSQHGSLETPIRFWGETFSEWSWGKLHLFGHPEFRTEGIFWMCFLFLFELIL